MPTSYINPEHIKEALNNASILDYFRSLKDHGVFESERKVGSEHYFKRVGETSASISVNPKMQLWYNHADGVGGNIIEAIKTFAGKDYKEAVQVLLAGTRVFTAVDDSQKVGLKEKEAPELNEEIEIVSTGPIKNPALKRYLCQRGLENQLGNLTEVHYINHGKKYFGAGIQNDSGGYNLRNPFFKTCLIANGVLTINNQSSTTAIFESYLDYLSYIELGLSSYMKPNVIVLNSTALVEKGIASAIKMGADKHLLYMDKDNAGNKATAELISKLCGGIDGRTQFEGKDLNHALTEKRNTPDLKR